MAEKKNKGNLNNDDSRTLEISNERTNKSQWMLLGQMRMGQMRMLRPGSGISKEFRGLKEQLLYCNPRYVQPHLVFGQNLANRKKAFVLGTAMQALCLSDRVLDRLTPNGCCGTCGNKESW
jgi:hypothetical protein